jgi:outer membrane protein TolC
MSNSVVYRSGRLVAVCMLLLCMPGCVNWSGDVALYRKVLDGSHPTTRPAFDPADPLPLTRALALADADNEAIALRGEGYIQALAEKMQQAGTFLPTLTLGPSYSLSDVSGLGTTHQISVPANVSANGSLSNVSNLAAAGYSVEQQAQLLLNEREAILLQVVQSYYSVLRAERQADVYVNGLKLKAEKVRDQEARLRLDMARPLDLAQSQADLAGTRARLTQSQTDAANARSALARLMGVQAVTGPLVDAFDPPAEVGEVDSWQEQALNQRQDLLAAARAVEAARASLESAIRQYFPSVSINYSSLLYSDPNSAQNWNGAISANIPVFSALSIEAGIRRAWSSYRQAGLAESQSKRQVIDDINQSFQNLQGSRKRIVDLETQVEAAQRAFDLSERAYQLGSVSNLDRLAQQDSLLQAQLNLVDEQFSQKAYYLALLRSAGGLSSVLTQKR